MTYTFDNDIMCELPLKSSKLEATRTLTFEQQCNPEKFLKIQRWKFCHAEGIIQKNKQPKISVIREAFSLACKCENVSGVINAVYNRRKDARDNLVRIKTFLRV